MKIMPKQGNVIDANNMRIYAIYAKRWKNQGRPIEEGLRTRFGLNNREVKTVIEWIKDFNQ